jgi:hypothetical protein
VFKQFTTADFKKTGYAVYITSATDDWEYADDQVEADIPKVQSLLEGQFLRLSFDVNFQDEAAELMLTATVPMRGFHVQNTGFGFGPRSQKYINAAASVSSPDAEVSFGVRGECEANEP